MDYLSGKFKVTLDEKGRISLPALLRKSLNEQSLYLTEGTDNCLWLYPSGQWNEMVNTIMKNTDPFSKKDRNLRRRIIGPAQEVEIDKAGRIPIAPSLREFSGLTKECVVLGQMDYIEIWDEERYKNYLAASDDEFNSATEELSNALKNKRGQGE